MKKSATIANRASRASVARSPSTRASALVVHDRLGRLLVDARLLERRLQLGVGDELAAVGELHVRLGHHLVGHVGVLVDPGEERRGQRGDQDRSRERGTERRAELRGGVLQPADLRARLLGHGRDGDGTELRGERRRYPAPITSSGPVDDARRRVGIHRGDKHQMPTAPRRSRSSTTRRGDVVGKNFGTPAAASSIVTESGVILIPVSIAESPSATDRYSGTTKKSPIITTNWKKNISSPPVICAVREHRGERAAPFLPRRAVGRAA